MNLSLGIGRRSGLGIVKKIMTDKNTVLFVYPINGYGWEANGKPIEPPENFHIELRSENEASVIENNHIFENLTIQITKRHVGKIDFSKSIADFCIEILSENNEVFVTGYGIIGKEELVLNWAKETFKK